MARNKVTVIGAGNVGATTAQRIARRVRRRRPRGHRRWLPQGKWFDLAELPRSSDTTPGSRGRTITPIPQGDRGHRSGTPARMSRDDLLAKNAGIVRAVVEQAAKHSPT
jgi:malate dehydrogenase